MTSAALSIGFRPFYFLAAAFAALAVPLWFAAYGGWLPLTPALPAFLWHAHEMVFGFAPAVIVGFLLTAVRNWTGRPTPSGAALAALALLWLAGRVAMLTGPGTAAALIDVAFLPVAAVVLAVPLARSRNTRNAFVVPLLLLLGGLAALHHAAYSGLVSGAWLTRAGTAAMDLVALLLTVIGGRVIPNFSANAVPGLTPRRWAAVEWGTIAGVGLIVLLDVSGAAGSLPMPALRALFFTVAALQCLRLLGWQPWKTRRNVLLLVLPLGYLWLPVHFALRGMLDAVPGQMAQPALHALAVGAMAGLMLAMMTRSARGHTGRPLVAGGAEVFMFTAIHLAALVRVGGVLLWPAGYVTWVGAAAVLWSLAFGAFAVRYAPILARPRADA